MYEKGLFGLEKEERGVERGGRKGKGKEKRGRRVEKESKSAYFFFLNKIVEMNG